MISSRQLKQLMSYSWPGNVRELRNIVERSMILCRGPEVTAKDLPALLRTEGGGAAPAPGGAAAVRSLDADADTPLAEVERQHILRVLEAHEGNKVLTAKVLEINVKTLYNKLKKYGLTPNKG